MRRIRVIESKALILERLHKVMPNPLPIDPELAHHFKDFKRQVLFDRVLTFAGQEMMDTVLVIKIEEALAEAKWREGENKHVAEAIKANIIELEDELKKALDRLDKDLTDEDKTTIKGMKKQDRYKLHFGLGMGIRNEYGLWSGGPLYDWFVANREVSDPDDMSGLIIDAYWERLQARN